MRIRLVLVMALVIVSSTTAADKPRLLIHRIGPSASTIHIARADGSGERALLAASAGRGE